MSKKELVLSKLKPLKKPEIVGGLGNQSEQAVIDAIHSKPVLKEKTKRITIDLPFPLYVEVKKRALDKDQSLKDFFIGLMNK